MKRGGSESLTSIESGMEEIGRRDVDEVSLPELPRIDLNDAPGSDSNNDDLIPTHPRTLTDASILSSVTTGSIDTVERRDNSASDASKQNLFLSDSMDSLQRETVPLAVGGGGGDDVDIDMPSLPSLLINEAGDVTVWGSPKGSGTPGRIVSPLGGTWLHKQPSEVTSLASDNEGNEGEEEERAGSPSPVEEDTGSRLSPVETPLLASDIVDVSSEPPPATTAESRDVTGLDAGDSWWQKALSTTDHELTDVLDEMEKNEESKETETIEGDHPQSSDSPKKDEEIDGGANLLFDDLTANSKGEKMDPKTTPLQLPKVDYVTQSSQLIRDAIDSEMQQDFRRAFDLYKQGVDMLLGGVQGNVRTNHPTPSYSVFALRGSERHSTTDGKTKNESISKKSRSYSTSLSLERERGRTRLRFECIFNSNEGPLRCRLTTIATPRSLPPLTNSILRRRL